MELSLITRVGVPSQTTGEATDVFTLEAEKSLEIAHWAPGKVTDLDIAPAIGKRWLVTVHVHVVETDV